MKPSSTFEPLPPASSVIVRAALRKHLLHVYLTKPVYPPVAPCGIQHGFQGPAQPSPFPPCPPLLPLSPLLTLYKPHKPPCCSSKPGTVLPQGLCMCCALFLECCSPRHQHSSLFHCPNPLCMIWDPYCPHSIWPSSTPCQRTQGHCLSLPLPLPREHGQGAWSLHCRPSPSIQSPD